MSFRAIWILLLVVLITGCGTQTPAPPATPQRSANSTENSTVNATNTPEEATGGELVIMSQEIAAGLDPVHELTSSYLRLVGAGEALMKVQADGSIQPELAESMKQLEPTTWEIKLRPNLTFWSGVPVNAEAVIASLERSRELDPQAAPFLEGMFFEVVDDLTIHIETTNPNPMTPANLSYYQLIIHNAAAYGDQANPFELEVMDLTGPMQVVEFNPKQAMILEPNPTYWGKPIGLERIRHEEVKDAQTRVLAAQSGQADIVTHIPAESASILKNEATINLVPVPAANTTTVYLNLKSEALSDIRVRQALNWAVNRQEVVDLAREGFSTPASTWLASNPAFPEAAQQGYTTYDLSKAQALLDEAGWTLQGDSGQRMKNGQPLTLNLMSFGGEKAVSEVLQQQWSKLGITVEVEHVDDYGLIQTRRDEGNWDAVIEAWSTFGDPQALMAGQFKIDGKANYGGFDDPMVADLFAQLEQTTEEEKRRNLILTINEHVAEQAPIVALHPRPQITAVNQRVNGFQPHFRQFEHIVVPGITIK